ncbi:MAG: DUF3577 domain-containing protein [Hydrogenovibrio crunogenus]|nr:DUF3577 domain-containing protein [Hydrogenovibrio crunogenus]
MTTQTQNTQTQSNVNEYYDVHTTGFAYLTRFREVKPKTGQRFVPFCSVTVAFCRGKVSPNKEAGEQREYTYVDCVIVNKEICEMFKPLMENINSKDSSVYGVFTVGDIYPETFTSNGEVKASIKGRLVGMKSLSVDNEVLFKKEPFKATDDQPIEQDENQEAAPQSQAEENNEANTAELPPSVTLDPNAPDFEAQRTALKEQGYTWNSANKTWDLSAA